MINSALSQEWVAWIKIQKTEGELMSLIAHCFAVSCLLAMSACYGLFLPCDPLLPRYPVLELANYGLKYLYTVN